MSQNAFDRIVQEQNDAEALREHAKFEREAYTFRNYYIRPDMVDALRRYVEHRIEPGSFLMAVLSNDFMEAAGRADEENAANLPAFAAYVYNEMPGSCHGSLERVIKWLNATT